MFSGQKFASNLSAVGELDKLARAELGAPVGQLAIAWTLANPAVHVSIVGTRHAEHVDEAIAAAELELGPDLLARIDDIVRFAAATGGLTPDSL